MAFDKNNMEPKKYSFLDYTLLVLQKKKIVFLVTLIIFAISVLLYFFVIDPQYLSTASLRSTPKSSGLLSNLDNLTDFSGIDDLGLNGGKTSKDLALYVEILNSRKCLEPLIVKFDLMKRGNFRYMEDAIKSFRGEQLLITLDKLSGLLYINVYDKDPIIAKEMVDFLLNKLNEINIEMNIQNAKNNREFIEKRYVSAKIQLSDSEDSLKSFQQIYGVLPDLQIKASAQTAFTIEAELKTEEVKLEVLKKILSADQVEVKTQETKINALREELSKIRNSTDINEILRLGNSPQIALSFLRLQRDVEIQTKILTFLLPVYEQAKIEENRSTPTIMILDNPFPAEKKSKPKRLIMVLLFTTAGFLSACCAIILHKKILEIIIIKKNVFS